MLLQESMLSALKDATKNDDAEQELDALEAPTHEGEEEEQVEDDPAEWFLKKTVVNFVTSQNCSC